MIWFLIVLLVFVAGYFIYMKFYYPKLKEKYMEAHNEAEKTWEENKDSIIAEYLSNDNKFGLISHLAKGEKIIGIISAQLPKSLVDSLTSGVVDTLTFTKGVDMAHYYLVATDKHLHYFGFDGEKAFLNEVFSYSAIEQQKLMKKSLTFSYKDKKFKFNFEDDSPLPLGYPLFAVHEVEREPTASDKSKNYFVREYFEFEFSNSVDGISSPEFLKDMKVREFFLAEFKKKLWLADDIKID